MAASLAAALVIGVISACLGSLYYCRQPLERRDSRRDEQESEQESPFVRIKISHPHRNRIPEEGAYTDTDERLSSQECTDLNNNTQGERKVRVCYREHPEVVPVKPPRTNRRSCSQTAIGSCCCEHNDRISKGIWSSAMQHRLENMSNSQASNNSDAVRLVRAQVEVYPCGSVSTSNETPEQIRQGALPNNKVNSINGTNEGTNIPGGATKRHHSTVVKKWKHLKKSIMCSRLIKSISIKEVREQAEVVQVEEDEMQRLNIPVRSSLRRSPVGHSTMLQKNRLVDASTSTRLSANVTGTNHVRHSGICANDTDAQSHAHGISREVVDPKDDSRQTNTEVLEDVVSLIKRRSVDGKSLCDVRITGLAMNQAELLDLFEATGGKSKSASIVNTEEASIISIKFQKNHRTKSSSKINNNANFPEDSSFSSIYKLIPGKLADITLGKWFSPDQKPSDEEPQFVRVPKHLCASPNETAYLRMPRAHSSSSQTSPFQRRRNISRRVTQTSFARFAQERRI